ncbi:MAG TPA: DNA polymerase III subunit epsilon [Cytophagales bacterium]|nr:DNA polymerase III subunit epsilon [Cytophagales bacterium]HAP61518.1 DNA polymerase III subunit epsilon [Cytophagales bacterium]
MKLHLKNPLAFFDLETTGTNIVNDRIVEYSFLKVMPNGEIIRNTGRVNPERKIPKESSMIHGIYDEDVKDEPTFKQVAKSLIQFLEGADLAGFNILKFDVPVLVEEFLRVEMDFDVSQRKMVDAQKIFFMMEKRTLSAAYKFYCGKDLTDAHSAEADTQATYEVLESQIERYLDQPVLDMMGKKVGTIVNDMGKLHDITSSNTVDFAGRLVYNHQGEEIFNFGKHKGTRVTEVFQKEPAYYDWMMRGDFPRDTKRKLTEIKLRSFNMRR